MEKYWGMYLGLPLSRKWANITRVIRSLIGHPSSKSFYILGVLTRTSRKNLAICTFFFVEISCSNLGHFIFTKTSFHLAKSYFSYQILAKTIANKKTKSSASSKGCTKKASPGWGTGDHPTREKQARIGNCVGGLVVSKLWSRIVEGNFQQFLVHQLSARFFARLRRSVGLGPCPMAPLRDELFTIAEKGSEKQMRRLLQDPEVNVNQKYFQSLVALHQSAEFNHDIGVT